jgi:hypothetical protein
MNLFFKFIRMISCRLGRDVKAVHGDVQMLLIELDSL